MQVKNEPKTLVATPPPLPPQPPKPPTEEEKRRKADRKASFISAGVYLLASTAGGVASWALNGWVPKTVGKAVEPVLNTATGVGQSAGGRFQEQITNPVRSLVNRTATGPAKADDGIGLIPNHPAKVVYPAALQSMIDVNNARNKLNGRVSGMAESFQLYTAWMQIACNAARKCIAAGNLHQAARHIAAQLVHDHSIWFENSPKSLNIYARLYLELYPYFHKLPADKLTEFRSAVHTEAVRLAGGKRKGIEEYVDAIVTGLTTRDPKPQFTHPLMLQAPGEVATISLEGRASLGQAANGDAEDAEVKKLLDEHYAKLFEGKGWFQRFKIRRQQKRVTRDVLNAVHERAQAKGRTLHVEEIWRIIQTALNTDVSRRIENKITAISFGAFAGTGAASGVGKFYLEKAVSPQIMVGLDAVVFTLVGIAMGTAGSFFQDRFNNVARAFGYGGLEKFTLGPSIERELLDNLLRTWTVDGRIMGGRYAYLYYSRYLTDAVINAQTALQDGDTDTAVDFLAGSIEYGRRMFFSFSPLQDAFDLLFMKLGPYFDGLSDAQRNELIQKVEERLKSKGATARDMGVYYTPFMRGLMLTNVEPKTP